MKTVVGIDEVGRGPLAGPVTVCAVTCSEENYRLLKRNKELPLSGKDSKKLKIQDREKYDKILRALQKEGKISYAIIHVSNKIIDSKGISFAIRRATNDALQKLKLQKKDCIVLLDGGLKAPENFTKQKTIIKGDEKEKIIAWASILAKVSRDAVMCRFSLRYPVYGFAVHKGYGTQKHRLNIGQNGLSAIHRATFCRNIDFIS